MTDKLVPEVDADKLLFLWGVACAHSEFRTAAPIPMETVVLEGEEVKLNEADPLCRFLAAVREHCSTREEFFACGARLLALIALIPKLKAPWVRKKDGATELHSIVVGRASYCELSTASPTIEFDEEKFFEDSAPVRKILEEMIEKEE